MKIMIKKREKLLKKLDKYSDFVRGSINSVCAKCNRAHCVCKKKTSRRSYRLTYKSSGQKTRIVYIPKARLAEIKKKIYNYSKAKNIIEEIIETNVAIFKKQAGS